MSYHADDLACLKHQLADIPMDLLIAKALLSDPLALVPLAGCALSLACLFVMVGKICSLLYDDDGNDDPQRTRGPQNRRPRTQGRSRAQRHERNDGAVYSRLEANRVQSAGAQGAPSASLQEACTAQPHLLLYVCVSVCASLSVYVYMII